MAKNLAYFQINCSNSINLFVKFGRPIKKDHYIMKLREDLNLINLEDLYFEHSLEKFKQQKYLDLSVSDDLKTFKVTDLKELYDELIPILDHILENKNDYLSTNKDSNKLLSADFVSFRSTLTHLLAFRKCGEEYTVWTELFEGTIYMQLIKKHQMLDGFSEYKYAKSKLEVYCSKRFDGKISKNETDDYFNRLNFSLSYVFENVLNQHKLLYSATMDTFENGDQSLTQNQIDSDQIKDVQLVLMKKKESKFKFFKSNKYWSQAKLINTKKVVVAFRDDNYIVDDIKEYSLDELVEAGDFNPNFNLYQLNKILTFIKQCFQSNKGLSLLKFYYKPYSSSLVCQTSEHNVLPDYYKKKLLEYSSDLKN